MPRAALLVLASAALLALALAPSAEAPGPSSGAPLPVADGRARASPGESAFVEVVALRVLLPDGSLVPAEPGT